MHIIEQEVRKVAIFIDLPNSVISAKQLGYDGYQALRKIIDLARQHGEISEGYAYADFKRIHVNLRIISQKIKPIHCPAAANGKSKIDDTMLIEGVHNLLRQDSDVFYVLATSDIMIMPLSMTLRSLHKKFIIYGFSQCASSRLKRMPEFVHLNRFIQKERNYSQWRKGENLGKSTDQVV